MNAEIKKILNDFTELKNSGAEKKELHIFYIKYKDVLQEFLASSNEYKSINGHFYKWYNLMFLMLSKNPWTFGTYNQLKKEWLQVQKWAKSEQILVPIFEDKTKETIKFFKTCFIFNTNQCEKIEKIAKV